MTDDLGTFTNDHTVRLERLIPGPIELVWEYLTKSEYLKTWFAVGDIEERVGARVTLTEDSPDVPHRSDHVFRGEVTHCDPPRLLSWTWEEDPPSELTFRLEQAGDQVKLTLTHERIPAEYLSIVAAGWHALLSFLVCRIEGETPEPFMTTFERIKPAYEEQATAVSS